MKLTTLVASASAVLLFAVNAQREYKPCRALLIAAFILGATLLGLRVPTVGATALGLADGNYTVTLDFSNNAFDTTATMTVGATGITAFHANIPNDGAFDCNPCTALSNSPDRVDVNGPATSDFIMASDTLANCVAAPLNCWILSLAQTIFAPNGLSLRTFDEPIPLSDRWSATPVPEPVSFSLLGFGAVALYLRRRHQS